MKARDCVIQDWLVEEKGEGGASRTQGYYSQQR
jgi:hypothetical protein